MPTYEYECKVCGHRFELFQNMTAIPASSCPKCQGAVKRLIGFGSGIIFKGSGFYETDYKRKEKKEDAKENKSPTCPGANKDCPASLHVNSNRRDPAEGHRDATKRDGECSLSKQ